MNEKEHIELIARDPHVFAHHVMNGSALTNFQMNDLQQLDSDAFFDWIWHNWMCSYSLGIYDRFINHDIVDQLDQDILRQIKNIDQNYSNQIEYLESIVNQRFLNIEFREIIEENNIFYKLEPRKDNLMSDKSIKTSIKKPIFISNQYVVLPVLGFHGFLKYHEDSIIAEAPNGANAYRVGRAFICHLGKSNYPRSNYDLYRSLFGLSIEHGCSYPEEMLHILQVKYYRMESRGRT